ncbi:breast cancer type 1 susceptibility protein [Trichosurus vulpecula]|uniref:breast cancer type 1 susceptibility protein n=1 Tax=Trichosurus vulpecula TaxID=9337 RepID=UPI00186B095F|nr:breast cancer type 1 susceptibility protein [Trichosurus vulpecula]
MDLSTVSIEEVKNVLTGMQKILECPICLELIKEPVSTTCDHIFCKFCMLKLLSKKKGPSQCPLCKDNITKRSLRESTRFNQLVEGLLKTIHAFELDTGFQFSNSQDFSKWRKRTPEPLEQEATIIHSRGYRNRTKKFKTSEPEDPTSESSLGVQLFDLGIRKGSLRRKQKKCIKNNAVYIELGSDSSEDGVKNAVCNSVEDRELCQASPQETRPKVRLKPRGKAECKLPEGTIKSLQQQQPNTEDVHVIKENATGGHGEESQSISSSNLNVEPCGTDTHASSLLSETTSLLPNTDRMNVEKTELCNKSKQPGLARNQQNNLDESKEICSAGKTPGACEQQELNAHHPCERQELEEKPQHPESPRGNPQNCQSGTKLKSSIQKVNEWLSRSSDVLASDNSYGRSHEENAEMPSVLEDGHPDTADGNSSISEKTDLVADTTDDAWLHVPERSCVRSAENNNIEDKIFGKTYRRKSGHPNLKCITENLFVEAVAPDSLFCPEPLKKPKLKRKRKTISDLQPEDFIKKTDVPVHKTPEAVDQILEKERIDQVMNTADSHPEQKALDSHIGEVKDAQASELFSAEKESTFRTGTEPAAGSANHSELELNGRDAKMTKKDRLRKKPSARIVHALELVVDRNPSSSNESELQIDSYPSSEEIRKENNSGQKQIRRSRRLQLLSEEIAVGAKKAHKPDDQAEESCVSEVFPDLKIGNMPACATDSLTTDKDQVLASCSFTEEDDERSLEAIPSSKAQDQDLAFSVGEGLQGERAQGSLEALEVPDTDWDTQDSASLLPANTPQNSKAGPRLYGSHCEIMETSKELLDGCSSKNTESGEEDLRSLMGQEIKNASKTTTEMEDSELDTQDLQNTFRRSKRQSFALCPSPRQECMKPCAVPGSISQQSPGNPTDCGSQEKEKQGNRESNKSVRPKSAVMSLASACQTEEGKPGDYAKCSITGVSRLCHIAPSHNDCEHMAKNNQGISQVPDRKQSISPARSSASKTIYTKNLLEERLDELTTCPETALGNESLAQSSLSPVSQSNGGECISKTTDLNRFISIGSSGEGSQAEKGENKESELNTPPKLKLVQPQVCQQSFSQNNCKEPKRKGKGGDGKLAQATNTDSSPCLEQTKESAHSSQVCSETPDLWDSDGEIKENASFAESDIKEQSAIFGKIGKSFQVRPSKKSHSPLAHRNPNLTWKSRRQARKLESSEEEDASSEEGELPSFQDLIFGKAASTPSQPTRNKTIAIELSANKAEENPDFVNRNSISASNLQISYGEASQDNNSSQDSECSGSLFSSHSNSLEDLTGKASDRDSALVFGSSKQGRSQPVTQEIQTGSEMPKVSQDEGERETALDEDHRLKDQGVDSNLGESASGYDSETSHPGDISQLSFQSDILTTQQRDTMQDNLKKLQQEMAVLEAALEQHGSQTSNRPTSQESELCPSMDQPDLKWTKSEKGAKKTVEHHKSQNAQSLSADKSQAFPGVSSSKNEEPGVEGSSLLESQMLTGDWRPLGHCKTLQKVDSSSEEGIGRIATLKKKQQWQPEEQSVMKEQSCVLKPNLETAPESEFGAKVYFENTKCNPQENKDTTLRDILNLPTSTSALRSSQLQTEESTNTSAPDTPACNVRGQLEEEASASERVKRGTGSLRMSLVASGLTPKEHMLVQKFARKTQSTLSNQITEGTTHVIMKTDADFVCERTLKYFLGIAGRKWVVSFLWVVQSFKEGKVLPECDFEVRGDVINGRNHRGPERARESQGMKIFKGLEICCYGPFTDMPTDHLEWMVRLCGATVVKKPSLLRPRVGSSPVMVVQPDAWEDDSSFQGIRLICEAPVVTREWVLDSVACYQRQELDTYLISQTSSDCC